MSKEKGKKRKSKLDIQSSSNSEVHNLVSICTNFTDIKVSSTLKKYLVYNFKTKWASQPSCGRSVKKCSSPI